MAEELTKVLRGAIPVILLLITIAFVLSIGSQVIDTTKGIYDDSDATTNITNESITAAFNDFNQLVNTFIVNTSVVVSNATGNYAQGLWQMNSSEAARGVINITSDINDAESLNITYDYVSQNKNAAFNASEDGLSALSTFSDFQPTFAIIVVAVLIIAVLIMGLVMVGMRVI